MPSPLPQPDWSVKTSNSKTPEVAPEKTPSSVRNVYDHLLCIMIRAKTFIPLGGKQRQKNLLLITLLLYERQGIKDFKHFTLILWL